ncbi:unnamed protein product [Diatraea saccharalis]|uniref:Secreted protein n=1 Tax=Diatraea saccharalis TaxID=40085 RepID=A0A9N9R7U3_9NEOP|nr:unnamed protein product [Diatraea saccharalis]
MILTHWSSSLFTALATSALNVQPSGCFMGYCDFVRCLRRTNSNNLIIQCTREARTGVNITLDADNVKFFTNVTSCVLARTRCSTFNPITGEPQIPGSSTPGSKISNALQFSDTGELRILAFPANTHVMNAFCAVSANLTQTNKRRIFSAEQRRSWLCPGCSLSQPRTLINDNTPVKTGAENVNVR